MSRCEQVTPVLVTAQKPEDWTMWGWREGNRTGGFAGTCRVWIHRLPSPGDSYRALESPLPAPLTRMKTYGLMTTADSISKKWLLPTSKKLLGKPRLRGSEKAYFVGGGETGLW